MSQYIERMFGYFSQVETKRKIREEKKIMSNSSTNTFYNSYKL